MLLDFGKPSLSNENLVSFFRQGGLNPWDADSRDAIMILSPIEQYLVQKEKRLFKGFEEYDDIHRFVFDLETTSLVPEQGRIFMIGMKDNRGYERVIEIPDNDESEKELMKRQCLKEKLMPHELAQAVLFFSSEQSSGCTNQSYIVDKGWL